MPDKPRPPKAVVLQISFEGWCGDVSGHPPRFRLQRNQALQPQASPSVPARACTSQAEAAAQTMNQQLFWEPGGPNWLGARTLARGKT